MSVIIQHVDLLFGTLDDKGNLVKIDLKGPKAVSLRALPINVWTRVVDFLILGGLYLLKGGKIGTAAIYSRTPYFVNVVTADELMFAEKNRM